jgi:sulfur-carrier protein
MPHVQFTRHLQRFFPHLDALEVEGATVAEVVVALDRRFPGLAGYLVDERGALRKHVNIFVGETLVRDRQGLTDPVDEQTSLYVMQALSGG